MSADSASVLAWREELGALEVRLGALFGRAEPRRQAGLYLEPLWGGRWGDGTIVAGSNADGASHVTAARRFESVPHAPGARPHDHGGHRDEPSKLACRRHCPRHRAPSAEEARTE